MADSHPSSPQRLSLFGLTDIGEIEQGSDLAFEFCAAADRMDSPLRTGDILVVAQKIVSKSEGRKIALADVIASSEAEKLAREVQKDPRLVEVILSESKRVVRTAPGVLIVEHRCGFILANAGIDQSNVSQRDGETVLLLPRDADASADALRRDVESRVGGAVGLVISDSFGRPWRIGTTGVAVGASGLSALVDRRGDHDRHGRPLKVTQIALADQLASAGTLVMGETDEGIPAAVIRGYESLGRSQPAQTLLRPAGEDLFR